MGMLDKITGRDSGIDYNAPISVKRAGGKFTGKTVLILTADDVQDLEFFYPLYRFTEEGCKVDVATPEGGELKGKYGLKLKETKAVKDIDAGIYDLLYIPGGKAPEALRENAEVIALVKSFVQSGKPVSAICHGPQVLASADVIRGRRIAAWPQVQPEVEEAGATYISEPAVRDGQFITARWPGDLPAHLAATLEALETGTAGLRKVG